MQDCLFACRSDLVYRAAAHGGPSGVAIGKSARVSRAVEVTVTSLNEQPVWLHRVGGSAPEGVEDLCGHSHRRGRRAAGATTSAPSAAGRQERARQTQRQEAPEPPAIYVHA